MPRKKTDNSIVLRVVSLTGGQDRNLLLRLVLVLALVWLPMAGLMAGMPDSNVSSHHASNGIADSHQHHGMKGQGVVKADMTMDNGSTPTDCAGHQAPCCSACISYCEVSVSVTIPVTPVTTDRYQRYSVPISIIVLTQDIRPPIV